MCSKNTVRESSHISFFCGRDPICWVVRRPVNTHGELTGQLEWPVGLSLRLRDQRIFPLRLSDQRISLVDLCLQSKITDIISSLKSHAELRTSSSPHVFSVYGWLSELTYFRFFSVICCSYLRTEISVILSTGNKLTFPFSCETILLMLSCDRIESAKFIVPS